MLRRSPLFLAIASLALSLAFLSSGCSDDSGTPTEGGCARDDDCPSTDFCYIPEGKALGGCLEGCRTDPDNCPDTADGEPQHCDTSTPGAQMCVSGEGPQGCTADSECADTEYCRIVAPATSGFCFEGCRTEPDNCYALKGEPKWNCHKTDHFCIEGYPEIDCTGTVECPTGFECNADTGLCDFVGCEGDGDCEGDLVCNIPTGECVEPQPQTCTGDGDCEEGETCNLDTGECEGPPPCTGDGDCEEGETCNLDTGECVPDGGCTVKADCGDGEYCDVASGECMAGECGGDDDCTQEGYHCDLDTHTCVEDAPVCEDDGDEPNDDSAGATALDGDLSDLLLQDLVLCPGNSDWFRFAGSEDAALTVTLTVTNDAQGVEMKILEGALELGSTEGAAEKVITIDPITGNDHFIQVYGPADVEATYELSIQLVEVGPCDEDDKEPNNDLAGASAMATGDVFDLNICPDNSDYFAFTVPERSYMAGIAMYDNAFGALQVQLLDTNGDFLESARGQAADSDRVLQSRELDAGDYYLAVSPVGEAAMPYSLELFYETLDDNACVQDRFEPNNDADNAIPLAVPSIIAGTRLCERSSDWYEVEAFGGEALTVLIEFFHMSDGDLDLYLYCGDAGTEVTNSETSSNDEALTYTPDADMTCWIEVAAATPPMNQNEGIPYLLRIR